eukprot:TRINITY_DN3361_c0_g2_i1.p1 TRINITY_DN3361_c0_g2~~TRINITY_DN3361_c0_g2_i1.p1  ORF type:complete len:254 (-),score=62.73 TRINITY_DN3361_c0_g2_i1:7-675(-)
MKFTPIAKAKKMQLQKEDMKRRFQAAQERQQRNDAKAQELARMEVDLSMEVQQAVEEEKNDKENKTTNHNLEPKSPRKRSIDLMPPPVGTPKRASPLVPRALSPQSPEVDGPPSISITPYKSSDEEDDSFDDSEHELEEDRPTWAKTDLLNERIRWQWEAAQRKKDPESIFRSFSPSKLHLHEIFPNVRDKRKRTRRSSAKWENDKVTQLERVQYNQAMGFK